MAELDVRSLVESAYNEAEAASGESAEAVSGDVAMGDAGVSEAAPGTAEASSDAGGSEQAQAKADRARDEKGKFATKSKTKEVAQNPASSKTAAVAEGSVGVPPVVDASQLSAPVVAAEVLKAPQGLTPLEREVFAKAPPEIQKALARLDQSARQALMESAPAKKLEAEFRQAVAPHEQMLRESGFNNPMDAVQSAFGTIRQLRSGSPHEVAQTLAGLAHMYGVKRFGPGFVEQFAGVFDAGPQQQQQQAQMDPRTIAAQVRQEVMQDFQNQRQQANQARIAQELQAFEADPANEFFHDLVPLMTAIIQASPPDKRPTVKEAYDRAALADPTIGAIMQKRANQVAAKATTASTQQARLAASSVKSTPSTGASSVKAPKTMREMVEASYDATIGGGR